MLCHSRYWGNWIKSSLAKKTLTVTCYVAVDIEVIESLMESRTLTVAM